MVGQNIGKYRVLDRVGRGGMGTVYRAIDETLHREVAIKVLNAELNDPEVAKRFRAEAITVARLSHPGIATIYELFQHEGQWLMVMEFVRGETLERLVERTGAQTPERAAELCMQSLAALAHAHSMGVVHRDLKPANIMVTETGTVKIMDFGIARVTGAEHLTNVGFMMGTPAYMAPEQVLGHEIDARADIYAMGVVFYRLVTSQLPFKGDSPFAMAQAQVNNPPTPAATFRTDLPPWVEQVMARSLAKKPDERFQSAVEFHEGFSRCLAGQPMTSGYNSSAPTGLMMTPPRAMPSGSIDRAVILTPTPTGASRTNPVLPLGTDMAPTIATPASTLRPATAQQPQPPAEAVDAGAMATILASGGTARAASTDGVKAPTQANAAGEPVGASVPSAASTATANKKGSGGLMVAAAIAVVLIGGGIGGVRWMRSRQPAQPAPASAETQPVAADPAVTDPSAAAGGAGATTTGAAAAPSATSTGPKAAPAGPGPLSPGAPGSTAAARVGAPAAPGAPAATLDPAAADAARRGAPPIAPVAATGRSGRGPVDDTHVALSDVKLLVVNGKKTKDEDVLVSFVAGQVSILSKKDSTPIAAWPYRNVSAATYVKARDPKWDSSLASPPDDLDVGGVLRTSKHWLVMQNKDVYLILRLADQNYARMIETVEARWVSPLAGLLQKPTRNSVSP